MCVFSMSQIDGCELKGILDSVANLVGCKVLFPRSERSRTIIWAAHESVAIRFAQNWDTRLDSPAALKSTQSTRVEQKKKSRHSTIILGAAIAV